METESQNIKEASQNRSKRHTEASSPKSTSRACRAEASTRLIDTYIIYLNDC